MNFETEMKQMENINKTSKIEIEISAKNWNCLRLGNSGTSSVRHCCDIWYFYVLTSSSRFANLH